MQVVTCLLLFVATCTAVRQPRDLAEDAAKYLLPGNVVPVHYDISLFTNIENFRLGQEKTFVFSGDVVITINALADNVSDIILHFYDDMAITSASISSTEEEDPSLSLKPISYDAETQKLLLTVSPPLTKNKLYKLAISYTGVNNDDLEGFYRSSYLVGLTRRWLLVTQFESFGARRAFPSFDEPKYKATFQLTVNYKQTLADEGYAAYFNTDVESETISGDRHITKFQKTPLPLSSYLVAFLISDFKVSPEPTYFNSSYNGENGTKAYRTIGQSRYFEPERADLLSQVTGPAVLNFITKKTRVGYGLGKMDQAGIPDFAAGAMENWGLCTYRESLVFWNENTGSNSARQSVATVTAHELGHQWFGDLVTLHWWSDVWLNEGFATYFEFHATDQIREPTLDTSSWDLIGQFVSGILELNALWYDGYSYSRPLTSEAYDRDSVDSFFDAISYDKGGSVLRMWQHILSEDLFYDGLNRYLTAQGANVGTPEQLLANWDNAIDALPPSEQDLPANVSVLLKEWHTLAGYPILTVNRQSANLIISQERFTYDDEPSSNLWSVPISYSTDLENNFNNTKPVGFLLPSQKNTTITLKSAGASWVVLNNQATGYYRINYDEDNWDALLDIISNPNTEDQIHPYNQAQIIDDANNLARSLAKEYRPYSTVLRLLKSLRHQRSLVIWRTSLRAMNHLLTHLSVHEETYTLLKAYFSWVVEPAFNELGLSVRAADSHTQKLLRVDVAKMACLLELPACKRQAAELFASRSAHPDVRELVMCEGVKEGGAVVWEAVLSEVLLAESPVRKELLSALTCTSDTSLLNRLIEVVASTESLSGMDKMDIVSAAAEGGRKQAELALLMLSKQKLKKSRVLTNVLHHISEKLSENEAAKIVAPISKDAAKAISLNQIWLQKKQPEILQWLKANKP